MPRGKKRVVAAVDLGPVARLKAKYRRLRKRADTASGAVKAMPRMLKRLADEYEWNGGMKRPATALELAKAIERMGDGIHKIEDAVEDFRRRLSSLEAKVFPDGSPGAGLSTEAAFAKSLGQTIRQKPKGNGHVGRKLVDDLMASGQGIPLADAANTEGSDII